MKSASAKSNLLSVFLLPLAVAMALLAPMSNAHAQGSIFGAVFNSDSTIPANGEISFFGFLDDTDEEIRIETSIGAGYDVSFDTGYWYDDFQNYLTEAPGNPYAYYFYNTANNENAVLSALIPDNSYQQEDILLAAAEWPVVPSGFSGRTLSSTAVIIAWNAVIDHTYHIYRRTSPSNGSFYRIDDLTGDLANHGVVDSFFIDSTVDGVSAYDYLIIAENTLGQLSPHSALAHINSSIATAPEALTIAPVSGPAAGGTFVTITGRGFDPAGVSVTIGGVDLTSVAVVSPYEITGITQGAPVGPADVIITNTASGLSSAPIVNGYTYEPSTAPVVSDIPDQTITEGSSFSGIKLDEYVTDPDNADNQLTWTYSGNVELLVNINVNRIASIQVPSSSWYGSEIITFRATDPDMQYGEDSAVFTVTMVNDPPVVANIPDQAIIGEGAFAVIDLDSYVADQEDPDSLIIWSVVGAADLAVNITDRQATVTIANPAWSGTETIIFRATDTGGESGEDSVTFFQVRVDTTSLDYNNVLAGRTDSVRFVLSTPVGFTLVAPQIVPSNNSVVIHREDDAGADSDIPPATDMGYWALWTPPDTTDTPGSITLSSDALENSQQVALAGRAVTIDFTPEMATYNFGDVNAVDRRACDTLRIGLDISGNIDGKIAGWSISGGVNDFSILTPQAGDTLITGFPAEMIILSHPSAAGGTSGNLYLNYEVNLGSELITDSISLINMSATGVVPGCAIVDNVVDFYIRKIGPTYTLPFTISNNSTVPEIIDSIYFGIYSDIFSIDPALARPFTLQPGDTDITVMFRPQEEMAYAAEMIVVDSNDAGDCDPPIVRGTGALSTVHWDPDSPVAFGAVPLCEMSIMPKYDVVNKIAGFDMVVDNVTIDSAGWFDFYPDLGSIAGNSYAPGENIGFDSIAFKPLNLLATTSFRMNLLYHVDTTGSANEVLTFIFASQTSGCAGILSASSLNFGSAQVGRPLLDTMIVSNPGGCDLTIDSIKSDNQQFTLPNLTLPIVVPPGSFHNLEISFRPTALGSRSGHLTFYHNGYRVPFDPINDCPLSSQSVVNLSGIGIDTSPPQVAEIIPHSCGQTLELVTADIGVGVQSLSTAWRRGNAIGGYASTSEAPVLIYTNHYQLQFSASDFSADSINLIGYEIRAIAIDGAGNADTVFQSISGCLPSDIDGGTRISAAKLLGGEGNDSLWHLVSFPGHLPTGRVDEIFENLSGLPPSVNTDDDTWRLYEYVDGGFKALTTNSSNSVIVPGRGYWFRHYLALDTLCTDTTGSAFTWATLPVFPITLDYGWNLIGSPYLFPVYINYNLIDIDSVSSFVRQIAPALPGGSNWWSMTDIGLTMPAMQPWKGYAIWCENPGGYTIYLDPHFRPSASAPPNQGWIAKLSLSSATEMLGEIKFGIVPGSSDGPDIWDVRPLAFFNRPAIMRLLSENNGEFIRDIRSESDLQVWTPAISAESGGPLNLSWSISSMIQEGKILVFYDAITGRTVDMQSTGQYIIENPSQIPIGRFRIYWGEENAVKTAIGAATPARPATFRLYQNYPNPFNPVTTISYDLPRPEHVVVDIFNVLGQRVVRLVDSYQDAGAYQFRWDGHEAATGIYLYRLQAGEYTETRKMLLMK